MPKTYSYTEFAKTIKQKYPQYSNVEDVVLSEKILEKYPEYKSKVVWIPEKDVQTIDPETLPIASMEKPGFEVPELNLPEDYVESPYVPPTIKDQAKKFTAGVETGYKQAKGGLQYLGGQLAGTGFLSRGIPNISGEVVMTEKARETMQSIPPPPEGQKFWYEMGTYVPQAAGSLAAIVSSPFTSGTSLSALPSILGTTNIAVLSGSVAGNSLMEYDNYVSENNIEPDNLHKWGVALLSAGLEAGLEQLRLGRMLPDGMTSRIFTKNLMKSKPDIGTTVLEKFAKDSPDLFDKTLKKLTFLAKQGNEEGVQEVLTQVGQDLFANSYKRKEDRLQWDQLFDNMMSAYKGGAIMGSGLGGASIWSTNQIQRKTRNKTGIVSLVEDSNTGEIVEITGQDSQGNYVGFNARGDEKVLTNNDIGESIQIPLENFEQYMKLQKNEDKEEARKYAKEIYRENDEQDINNLLTSISHNNGDDIIQVVDNLDNVWFVKEGNPAVKGDPIVAVNEAGEKKFLTKDDIKSFEASSVIETKDNLINQSLINLEEQFETEDRQQKTAEATEDLAREMDQFPVDTRVYHEGYPGKVFRVSPDISTDGVILLEEESDTGLGQSVEVMPDQYSMMKVIDQTSDVIETLPYDENKDINFNTNLQSVEEFATEKEAAAVVSKLNEKYPNSEFEALNITPEGSFAEGKFIIQASPKNIPESPLAEGLTDELLPSVYHIMPDGSIMEGPAHGEGMVEFEATEPEALQLEQLANDIVEGKDVSYPEQIQLQNNYPRELEQILKNKQDAKETSSEVPRGQVQGEDVILDEPKTVKKDDETISKPEPAEKEIKEEKVSQEPKVTFDNFVLDVLENEANLNNLDVALNNKERQAARKNILDGKDTKQALVLLDRLKEFYDNNTIRLTRGSGKQVSKTDVSVEEFFEPSKKPQGAEKIEERLEKEFGVVPEKPVFKKKDIIGKAKKHFGETSDLNKVGFVTPDGTMLNIYEGVKRKDHNEELEKILGKSETYKGALDNFLSKGNIRIAPESGDIEIHGSPTNEQKAVLKRIIRNKDSQVSIDFRDGEREASVLYNKGTNINRIINDVSRFYTEKLSPVAPRFKKKSELGLYSNIENAIEQIKQEKATPEQWKAMLLKNGAKENELEWMGFDEFAKGKTILSKNDLSEFVNNNKVEVNEVTKGGVLIAENEAINIAIESIKDNYGIEVNRDNIVNIIERNNEYSIEFNQQVTDIENDVIFNVPKETIGKATKYSQYTLPGGENYKEVLLTMPIKEKILPNYEIVKNKYESYDVLKDGKEAAINQTENQANEFVRQEKNRLKNTDRYKNYFKSGHFDEPNILAHVRLNERIDKDGNKVLFIEELQSDWSQSGREFGFKTEELTPITLDKITEGEVSYGAHFSDGSKSTVGKGVVGKNASEQTIRDYFKNILRTKNDKQENRDRRKAPDMPFKQTKDWINLAMKRMLVYASENGFDKIAWTPGQIQADRYDLSKQIKSIDWGINHNKTYDVQGDLIEGGYYTKRGLDKQGIADNFGKEIAEKIVSSRDKEGIIKGVDLKVGGEGMKSFYDNILPNISKKLVKKFDSKIERTQIDLNQGDISLEQATPAIEKLPSDGIISVQSIPVTEKLQRVVSETGLPLFKKRSTPLQRIAELEQELADMVKRTREAINTNVKVIKSMQDLSEDLKKSISKKDLNDDNVGLYDRENDEVYIISENIDSVDEAMEVVLHEAVGHKGLRKLLGKKYDNILDPVYKSMDKKDINRLEELYGTSDKYTIADEYLAEMAEKDKKPTFVQQAIAKIRELLRNLLNLDYTDNDIYDLLRRSKKALQKEGVEVSEKKPLFKKKPPKPPETGNTNIPPEHRDEDKMIDKKFIDSRWDRINEFLQDKMLAVKKWQDFAIKKGAKITDGTNPYVAENLMSSKIKNIQETNEKILEQPFLESVNELANDTGLKVNDVEDYLLYRRAIEANNIIKDRRLLEIDTKLEKAEGKKRENLLKEREEVESIDKYTWASTKEAKQKMELFEKNVKDKKKLEAVLTNLKKVSDTILDNWYKYGIISKQSYDELKEKHKNYVPMRGWEEDLTNTIYEYQNDDIGKVWTPIKKMEGRSSKPDSPIPYLINMLNTSVIQGEKNRVKQAMARFISNNKDKVKGIGRFKKVYEVKTKDELGNEIIQEFTEEERNKIPEGMSFKEKEYFQHEKYKPKFQAQEHEMDVFIGGKKYTIVFNDPNVGRAMNNNYKVVDPIFNTDLTGLSEFMQGSIPHKFTRWWSKWLTGQNPAFFLPNQIRDFGFGFKSIFVEEGVLSAARWTKNYFVAAHALNTNMVNLLKKDSKLYGHLQDFIKNGGETGYTQLKDVDEYKKDIKKQIKKLNNQRAKMKYFNPVELGKLLDRATERLAYASENSARFATYLTAIQNGKSHKRAAYEAKNSTVNFNRKGRGSGLLGSVYAFFNARVQGIARYWGLAKTNPYRFSTVAAFDLAKGYMLAQLLSWWWGDDDEKKDKGISHYMKGNYINIPIPGAKEYISVPLSHGFGLWHALGVFTHELSNNKIEPGKFMEEAMSVLINNSAPIDISRSIYNTSPTGRIRGLVPTALSPFYDVMVNENYGGYPIRKISYTPDLKRQTPTSQLYRKNVSKGIKLATDKLFELGGGNPDVPSKYYYKNGEVEQVRDIYDWNPSNIEYLLSNVFAGKGKFYTDMYKSILEPVVDASYQTLKNNKNFVEVLREDQKRLEKYDIPIINRFYRNVWTRDDLTDYYEGKKVVTDIDHYMNQLRKSGKTDDLIEIKEDLELQRELSLFKAYSKAYEKTGDPKYRKEAEAILKTKKK